MTTVSWTTATRERLRAAAPGAVAVLPVGAVEQHGPHLPTGTDAAVVDAIAREACARTADDVTALLAPTLAYGSSDHHLPFGGTLSLAPATLAAVLGDLLRSLRASGCERALIVNGHGGNADICGAVAHAGAVEHDMLAAAVSYWHVSTPPKALADLPFPGHAGAFETSLMLALAPADVDLGAAAPSPAHGVDGVDPDVGERVALSDPRAWRRIGGWTDDPRRAAADVGAEAIDRAAAGVAGVIEALARHER